MSPGGIAEVGVVAAGFPSIVVPRVGVNVWRIGILDDLGFPEPFDDASLDVAVGGEQAEHVRGVRRYRRTVERLLSSVDVGVVVPIYRDRFGAVGISDGRNAQRNAGGDDGYRQGFPHPL